MLLSFKHKSAPAPTGRSIVIARLLCVIALFCFTYCGRTQDAAAQFGGIDGGDIGIPTDGGDLDGGNIGGGDLGTGGFGGTGGIGGGGAGGFGNDFGNVLGGEETVDQRNQGFVGATSTEIQANGFIGSPGELSGPPNAGVGFGGGTNNVGGTGGGAGGRANNQNNNTGFGGTGQVKGFEIFRSSVRANLRPQFSAPQVNGSQIANRFQNRIRRLPNMANYGTGVQVGVSNGTATIQGFVRSAEEHSRIERQLRLEPGVYRINNQTQIIGR